MLGSIHDRFCGEVLKDGAGAEARTDGVSVEVGDGAALDGVRFDGTFTLRCEGDISASDGGGRTVTVGNACGGGGMVLLMVSSCWLGVWGAGIGCGRGGRSAIVKAFFRRMR